MTAATENGDITQVAAKLRTLRLAFIDALIALCERRDENNQLVPPSAAELNVIRGVLRDNNLAINASDGDEERKLRALNSGHRADLPEFDDPVDEDDTALGDD